MMGTILFFIGALIGGVGGSLLGVRLAERSVYGKPRREQSWIEETQEMMQRYDQHHDWRRPTID